MTAALHVKIHNQLTILLKQMRAIYKCLGDLNRNFKLMENYKKKA